MKVVTSQEMAKIDNLTIEKYGIPPFVLMERAALSVSNHVIKECPDNLIILAGPGNNGGDGVAVGRILSSKIKDIKIFQIFSDEKLSSECKFQIEIAKKFKVSILKGYPTKKDLQETQVIVDALFGTGLTRNIEGELVDFIKLLNSLYRNVIAIDIPSGISSDSGEVLGEAIKAKKTISFGLPKRGHILYPGKGYVGELIVEDIGFPEELTESEDLRVNLVTKNFARKIIPERPAYSHKGKYGHVLVVAGSVGKTGAALMTAKSALRTGSGLVTLAIPAALKVVFQSNVLEEMILPLQCNTKTLSKESAEQIISFVNEKADSVAFGPGVGINEDTEEILKNLLMNCSVPIVIDADGITLLSKEKEILRNAKAKTVITPHPGELSRLIGISVKDIEKQRIDIAMDVAKELNTIVVLKGVPTVISDGEQVFVNTTGNPGMSTGGSGDVLTGMISSLIGQGVDVFYASILGVYLHGLSGDIGASGKGYHGLIARDIIENIPFAIKETLNEMD